MCNYSRFAGTVFACVSEIAPFGCRARSVVIKTMMCQSRTELQSTFLAKVRGKEYERNVSDDDCHANPNRDF